jgi:hypothetical protein
VPVIDLHCHTTASDGTATPTELVDHAAQRNVTIIAVTDHDTVAGVAEAQQASAELGVRVVAGIELSTRYTDREVHILGYFIDAASTTLLDAVSHMRSQRFERGLQMVQRLCELGYDLSMDDVLAESGGGVVGRPHVARALVARGHIASVRDAFTPEFIADGGRAYVPRQAPDSAAAVELIGRAGGVAVVAHPGVTHHAGQTKPLSAEAVEALARAGVVGLEVDHPDHPPLVRDHLHAMAHEYGLIPTGGSDWHGLPEHTLGGWTTSDESFERLEQLAGRSR